MANNLDTKILLRQYDQINNSLVEISKNEEWTKLPDYLRHPGWTTPAEFLLFNAHMQVIQNSIKQIQESQAAAMKAAPLIISK